MRTRQIAHLRPDEILPELAQAPVAYLPLGLLEWHGPHLPLGVDSFNAEAVALQAADISGGFVFPTVYFGTERERPPDVLDNLGFAGDEWIVGMDFPANSLPSLYAREDLFALMLRENFRLIQAMGCRVIVAVSGHGATNQIETMQRVAAEFNATGAVQVITALAFVEDESGVLAVGHASRVETAIMLALQPETVKLDNLPPLPEPLKNVDYAIVDYPTFFGSPTPDRTVSAGDDPRRATADAGHANMQRAAAQIAALAQAALNEAR